MERKRKKNLTDLDESALFKPGTISQDDVLLIAHELGSLWEMVGRVLKVPDAVIDEIEAGTDKVSKKCYRVLKRWQQMYPSNATYHRLARALMHPAVGRVDLVDKYCGLQLGKDVVVGTSSEPETTTQRVKGTKLKRDKNFTASDEEEYDVDEGEESIEEEIEEEDQPHEPTKKKEKKTGKVSKLLVDLVNDASDSLKKICNCFDTPLSGLGNYEDVAKYYHYDIFTIQARFKTSPDGPSKALILAMIGEHPRVTVENFARVVEKQAKRKDVAILLREFDCK